MTPASHKDIRPRPSLASAHLVRLTAASASAGAAVVHAAVVRDHWAIWWASGAFFAALAVLQLGWAVAVLARPTRRLLALGVLVNLAAAALWGLTRVVGNPVGPNAGVPLPVGPSGVLAVVLEAVVVMAALWGLWGALSRRLAGPVAVLAPAAVLATVLGLTVPGVSAALQHDHGSHVGGGHDDTGHGGGHDDTGPGGHDDTGHGGTGQHAGQDRDNGRRGDRHAHIGGHENRPSGGDTRQGRRAHDSGGHADGRGAGDGHDDHAH